MKSRLMKSVLLVLVLLPPLAQGKGEDFAIQLYHHFKQEEGNLLFSPYSLRAAFVMAREGARGETAIQMDRLMGRTFKPISGINSANSLWVQKELNLLPLFLETLKEKHGAEPFALEGENSRIRINQWAEKITEGGVKELLKPGALDKDTAMVLANALCFKGQWVRKFDPKRTSQQPFYLKDAQGKETQVSVPLMCTNNAFGFKLHKEFILCELPYYGNDLSMVVLLPKKRDGLARLEKQLTPRFLSSVLRDIPTKQVTVFLPRFKATAHISLKEALRSLGLKDAFDSSKADFSGMTGNRDLWIHNVAHGVAVEVDEEGTKVAVATGIILKKGGALFRADHPFVYLIRDKKTGGILLMGRLTNPL